MTKAIWGVAAACALATGVLPGPARAGPGDPMVTLLAMRPLPERALVVELRDPDGRAVWPVVGEVIFEKGPAKKVKLGPQGLRMPLAEGARAIAIRIDASRWDAPPVRYPIAAEGGVRITLRYVPE